MEFEEWSNKKKERQGFENWSNDRKRSIVGSTKSSYSAPFYGSGDAARIGVEPTKPVQAQPAPTQPVIKTTPARSRGGITLPNVEEIDAKAKAAQSQAPSPETRIPENPAHKPYIAPGQANKLGIEPAPKKPFTFSQSPKAEIPANRFSGEGGIFPGFEARTGMPFIPSSAIPSSVNVSPENLLEATPLGAYTHNWNIEEAAPPVPAVFATMDDETLSQLITEYSDQMRKLKSQGLLESGEKSYGERTLDQLVLGNYSDDTTLLGTAAQVGMGLLNLDLPMDVRDLTYDLTNWEWTPEHIAQTLMDAVGFIPVIGSLKYADEFAAVLKNADEVADLARKAPELVELARDMGKLDDVLGSADEFGELLESAPEMADLLKNTDETIDLLGSTDEFIEGAGKTAKIGKLDVVDGKVGGKIPVDDYNAFRSSSLKNPNSNSITLGKYADDATSYTKRAGDTSYFDMGSNWAKVQEKYKLSDTDMFEYFNTPVLNDAISSGKVIRFSHDPRAFGGGFLKDEWEYLKSTLDLTDSNLFFKGGFWYVK